MITVHAAIGNSDDKLSQQDWSEYVHEFQQAMQSLTREVYGVWFSAPDSVYQNCCIAAGVTTPDMTAALRDALVKLRHKYGQESIAMNISSTEFV